MNFLLREPTETLFVYLPSAYLRRVNEPLAILLSSRGLIATQLGERLEALRYRKMVIAEPLQLRPTAEAEHAMIVFADLEGNEEAVAAAVQLLRTDPGTAHIPAIGFRREMNEGAQNALISRGFTVVVSESAILNHLPQLLDRALDIH